MLTLPINHHVAWLEPRYEAGANEPEEGLAGHRTRVSHQPMFKAAEAGSALSSLP